MDTRHPNPQGSSPDSAPTEEQLLVGEMVGSTAFGAYLKSIVLPRIAEFRQKLLTDMELSPDERRVVMARMDEHRVLLTRVFEQTEAAELPPEIEKFFR